MLNNLTTMRLTQELKACGISNTAKRNNAGNIVTPVWGKNAYVRMNQDKGIQL